MDTSSQRFAGVLTVVVVLLCLFMPLLIVVIADNNRYRRGTDIPIQHAVDMVHTDEKSSIAHNLLGHAYMRQGSYGKAAFEYRKAIKYGPDFAGNHLWLAEALIKMNEIPKAKSELLKAQSMSSEDDDTWKAAKAMLLQYDTLQSTSK